MPQPMIKYITLTIKMLQEKKISSHQKLLFGAISVLTKKGTVSTTASNKYLGTILGIKNDSQISTLLKALKKEGVIIVGRDMGRRQISLNTEKLVKNGYLSDLKKEVKNV